MRYQKKNKEVKRRSDEDLSSSFLSVSYFVLNRADTELPSSNVIVT